MADGVAKNGATATVTDANGNVVPGVEVNFTIADGAVINTVQGTTDEDGIAIAEMTSIQSGSFKVKASVAGGSASFGEKTTRFVADESTAEIKLAHMGDSTTYFAGSRANFTATAVDANGNLLSDAEFEVSATGSENTVAEILTLTNGVATLFVSDTKVGDVVLNVSLKDKPEVNASSGVTFTLNTSAALHVRNFIVVENNALSGLQGENVLTFDVTDNYGNTLPKTDNAGYEQLLNVRLVLSAGEASHTLRRIDDTKFELRIKASHYGLVQAYLDNCYDRDESEQWNSNIRANKTSTFDPLQALFVVVNDSKANGIDENVVKGRVYTGTEGPEAGPGKSGASCYFKADNDAVLGQISKTDSEGYCSVSVKNTKTGLTRITFTVFGERHPISTDVNFTNAATILDNDLHVAPDNAVANGTDKIIVTANVTDGNGTAAAGEEVSFSVEDGPVVTVINGTSDAEGKAIAELTSTAAGTFRVTTSVNGNGVSKNATFIADKTTAAIELTRTDVQETYVAGTRIGYTVVAKDANGNIITDAEFDVHAEGGSAASASVTANNNGVGILSLYDTRAGETKLTVTLANNAEVAADDTVTYVPDESSSKISNMTVVKDWALAAFLEENIVTFDATDTYGNVIPSVDTDAFRVTVAPPTGGRTDWRINKLESGSFEIRVKGDISNSHYIVGVTYGDVAGSRVTANVWFAGILAPLSIEENNAPANGQSKNVIKGRIYHGLEGPNGSLGPRLVRLNFKADNGAILTAVPGSDIYGGNGTNSLTIWSDSAGYAGVEVTNIIPGDVTVTMTELSQGTTQSERTTINFEPVVELKDGNVVIDPDNAPADGVSKNVVTATVTDQSGSPVSGAEVSFEVEEGPVLSVVNRTTGTDGKAVAELTSLQKGVFNVTAKVNNSEVTKPATFISD
ncbi:Ig-like domain-containing protein, partial [Lelliottia nimipressuralis]|uniref:Ig-like domain-containing protein n=1 Tax=Lelliottia nimipressuralis TaxID=69220 RepID=UPI0013E97E7B